jgi:hypothetical protein
LLRLGSGVPAAAGAPTSSPAAAPAASASAAAADGLRPAPGSPHAAQPNVQLVELAVQRGGCESGSVRAAPAQPQLLAQQAQQHGQQGRREQQGEQQEAQQAQQQPAEFYDYCNGGPVFLAPGGSTALGGLPGVLVLATFKELGGAAAALRWAAWAWPAAGALQRSRSGDREGGAGGGGGGRGMMQPAACGARGAAMAWSADALRACRCRVEVGEGVAVLCGTHPELAPGWLPGGGFGGGGGGGPDVAAADAGACSQGRQSARQVLDVRSRQAGDDAAPDAALLLQHASALRRALLSTEAVRTRFWRLLLAHALRQQGLASGVVERA